MGDLLHLDSSIFLNNESEKKRAQLREKSNKAKLARSKSVLCVLENPSSMANIASAIRNVDALGIQKLYIVRSQSSNKLNISYDWQILRKNENLLKLSVGAVKWVYIRQFKTSHECLTYLSGNKYVSIGTSPHIKGKTNLVLSDKLNLPEKKLAVWFGNETIGLTKETIEHCSKLIQIPMSGITESFNLGSCTALVLFQILQNRRNDKNKTI